VVWGWAWHVFVHLTGFRASMNDRTQRVLLRALVCLLVLTIALFPLASLRWQQFVSRYVGADPPGVGYVVGSTGTAVVVFALVLGLWRVVATLSDWILLRVESRVVRESFAHVVAGTLTLLVIYLLVSQGVVPAALAFVGASADRVNAAEPAGLSAPTSPLRTGGPGSPVTWSSLGQDGAAFVASGPDAKAITDATGRPAVEPIRVFAGLSGSMDQTRDAALAELDRTHAWERRAILVVTATSTGYINPWVVSSFEALLDGNTATVSMQYSNLPSAFGLLTARAEPPQAARLLLDAVRARLAGMPAAVRPKLYVSGESLGAFGSESAFSSPQQMLDQVDGALWSGTPTFAKNRTALTAALSPGSTVVNPVVDEGRHIRFASRPSELTADQYGHQFGPWLAPRVAYLQHDTDPVAWWSTDLLFEQPAWLRDAGRGNPMAQMNWMPLVTFMQVTADMAVSNDVPGGFGHRYKGGDLVPAWAAVLGDTRSEPDQARIIAAVGK
ncbi:alpha/beta-hydrolase family protein, partial [Lapillicoccus sp.]|uniref:alpha/beta-hydrolase family protein n=1 Tax=Lapillicoccus sp. TaxID=1909287 RepID=UPI0025E4A22E